MSDRYTDAALGADHRSARLERVLTTLLGQAPEMEAAAVVSFDGLPMASALPHGLDEDRVAAMSAALLSLGERAAQGLGRGDLSQVYVEGEEGTVFLVSADDEAVLVAVGARGAKVGLLLFEVRRAAEAVAATLRDVPEAQPPSPAPVVQMPPQVTEQPPAARPEPQSEPQSEQLHVPPPATEPVHQPQPVLDPRYDDVQPDARHARPAPAHELQPEPPRAQPQPQPQPVAVGYLPEPEDDRRWHERSNGSQPERTRGPEPTAWT